MERYLLEGFEYSLMYTDHPLSVNISKSWKQLGDVDFMQSLKFTSRSFLNTKLAPGMPWRPLLKEMLDFKKSKIKYIPHRDLYIMFTYSHKLSSPHWSSQNHWDWSAPLHLTITFSPTSVTACSCLENWWFQRWNPVKCINQHVTWPNNLAKLTVHSKHMHILEGAEELQTWIPGKRKYPLLVLPRHSFIFHCKWWHN